VTSEVTANDSANLTGITVGKLADLLATVFRHEGFEAPLAEAREIIAALYDAPRFWPIANAETVVDQQTYTRAQRAMVRRVKGAPLAYAVGRASFRNLTLDVDERVLIPRPETEQLVDLVLEHVAGTTGGVAIDVGVGSGAIAISLACEGAFSRVYGTDISRDALVVANENVAHCRGMLRASVDLVHGSLLAPLLDVRAKVVVSNPPYIALGEAASLPASVRDWEPAVALYSGSDGMTATARLVREAADVLESGGLLALEVDARRASLAAELVSRERRFDAVRVELDLYGRERFVLAVKR
jgi:release factor glutamine methyltransferase